MRSLPTDKDEENSSALFSEFLVSPHSSEPVGRLQMANDFRHAPVLVDEIVDLVSGVAAGVIVDATLGGGGHARAILDHRGDVRLIGIDRDPVARRAAAATLEPFGDRVEVLEGTFDSLGHLASTEAAFLAGDPVVAVLFDLGVSSPQLDDPSRGFSYRADAPLDMRMDPDRGPTAAELLAGLDESSLASLLRRHGENRFAGPLARAIMAARPSTTLELVEVVERTVSPAARRRGHVASRVFQALRVEVNDEEGQLERGLVAALGLLAPGGLLAVISYHSGEDRTVKAFLHEAATGGCHCPRELGCVCGAVPTMTVPRASARLATSSEIARNARARSARLRYGWKVAP